VDNGKIRNSSRLCASRTRFAERERHLRLHENPPASCVVHVHAFVFTIWLLLLSAQILLVVGNQVASHRRLGWFAAIWICRMAILGAWAAMW